MKMIPVSTAKDRALFCAALGTISTVTALQAQPDYAPAIWNPPGCVKWYTSGNGHHFCVIHDMEGYYLSSISYLNTCGVSASVYYAVNGKQDTSTDALPGQVTQMVRESNYAWHACCWNTWMFGTEHEGFASNPAWYTESLYQSSSALQRHLCGVGSIPQDRNHIIGHNQWQNGAWKSWMAGNYPSINTSCNTHTDPGSFWDWGHFMNLMNGSTISPDVAVVRNSNGALEIFDLGSNTAQWHNWQGGPNGGWQPGWSSLGMAFLAQNVATKNADGRQQVFALGLDKNVYTAWMQTSGTWSSWLNLGGGVTSIAVNTNSDGRIEVFGISTNTSLVHCAQSVPNGGIGAWSSLGGAFISGGLTVGQNADGRLQVFVLVASDNSVRSTWQLTTGGWSAWTNLGGSIASGSQLTVMNNTDGRMEVFGVGTDTAIWHIWQAAPNGGWSAFASLGGGFFSGRIVASKNADGRLEVFALNVLGAAYTFFQQTGGGWSGLVSMGGAGYRSISCGINADGRMELFTRGSDGMVWHSWQGSPNGGWSGWYNIGLDTFE